VKSALQVQHDLDAGGTSVTYNFIANSMAATATNSTEVARSNVSGLDSQGGKDLAPESGVRDKSGTICTGYYPNWMSISDKDKQTVYDECKRLGPSTKKKTTGRKTSSLKSKKKELASGKRVISSLKAKAAAKKHESSEDDDGDEEEPQDNAGDQFGSRNAKSKKQKKKK
jgi:hypothetical protein